ncbi:MULTISPECIES: hypothetical protein [unclassified Crossiella]|uniref:hypothetical protein n=1 Tax=unclassified Crossiella TaxID=2620835 RepID=UPI001FFFD7F1|nr:MULTISPECIES: hypothetical protein [unclassified Crossiella]MCK2240695.1 hypothetical protein [Crossiella sp. S99.2]MCK2252854.1 hypothetical protein [Crossiella sp. S99.1]
MAKMQGSVEATIGISHGFFEIWSRGLTEPPRFFFSDPSMLHCVDNAVALTSKLTSGQHSTIRLEAWDAEPSEPQGVWGDRAEEEVLLTSATVELFGVTAGHPSSDPLELGLPGYYQVRAFRTRSHKVASGDDSIQDAERFLVQFWPSRRPTAAVEQEPTEAADLHSQITQWARQRDSSIGPGPGLQ